MAIPLDESKLAQLPMNGGLVEVRFLSREDIRDQNQQFLGQMSLFLTTSLQLQQFCEFSLVMHLPDGTVCDPLSARLVQVVPFGETPGLLLQLLTFPETVKTAIQKCLEEEAPDPGAANTQVEAAGVGVTGKEDIGKIDRLTLHDKLRKLNVSERSRLAGRADKLTRTLLIRDNEPQILMFLLKNPQITRGEVTEISKSTKLNYQIVQIIMGNKTWFQSEEIRYNLVRNPKTPLPIVLKIIPALNTKHIRELAKNQGIKYQIKQAALRIVLERSP